jgi:hypothetical protein
MKRFNRNDAVGVRPSSDAATARQPEVLIHSEDAFGESQSAIGDLSA